MPSSTTLILDGDNAWPDLRGKVGTDAVIHVGDGSHIQIAALPGGMTSGKASVMFRFDLPDGHVVLYETSLANFLAAARALAARYGW